MKGIIFNLAEEVVTANYGPDRWDDLLEASGLDGAYTSLGSYEDAELLALVAAAAEQLDVDHATVVRTIGIGAIPLLAERFPRFFEGHDGARSFVLTVNDIIHPEVRKLYPGADVPEFTFDESVADELVIGYSSARRLCALAEGFITGAAAQYGETVELEQPRCLLRGDASCIIRCRFSPASAS